MITDGFPSHTVSLVLSWIFGLIFCAALPVGVIGAVFDKGEQDTATAGTRIFAAWVVLCAIALSPLRYFLLQFLLTETFGVQSFSALLATAIFAIPVGFAFITLYLVGIVLPFLGVVASAGSKDQPSRSRVYLSAILAPALFYIGNLLFFWMLPYAAYSCHWLRAKDIMRATNGPAEYFYRFAVDWDIPYLSYPLAGSEGDTAKERLRAHLAALYVGKKGKRYLTSHHFNRSFEFSNASAEIINKGTAFTTLEQEEFEEMVRLQEAALSEARKVDVAILNERLVGLGDHYRDEFIVGMEKLLEGHKTPDDRTLFEGNLLLIQGHRLLDRWGDWYENHRDEICQKR